MILKNFIPCSGRKKKHGMFGPGIFSKLPENKSIS